jgi:DNA replication protein DnaC
MLSHYNPSLMLKALRLPAMQSQWQDQASLAQKDHWTYEQYLHTLLNMELCVREQKRIERHLKAAKLPAGKTLDRFDFDASPSINAAQIKALAENPEWACQANNILLFGPSGVGKTHLAAAIAYRLIEQGVRAVFWKATALVQRLQQARQDLKMPEMLAKLARIPVLILDDIAYVKKTEAETSVLFELIADRYESNSLIITSNQPFDKWEDIFPDNVMAVAAIDRLVHHATIISITEQSYRKNKPHQQG